MHSFIIMATALHCKTNQNTIFLDTTVDIIIWTNCWTNTHFIISDNVLKLKCFWVSAQSINKFTITTAPVTVNTNKNPFLNLHTYFKETI